MGYEIELLTLTGAARVAPLEGNEVNKRITFYQDKMLIDGATVLKAIKRKCCVGSHYNWNEKRFLYVETAFASYEIFMGIGFWRSQDVRNKRYGTDLLPIVDPLYFQIGCPEFLSCVSFE
jgi:hypothetical protein